MNTARNPDDEIRRLIAKHVPEVASGAVELVSVAREVGDRVEVAVRSHDSSIHPVSACVGKGGVHLKNIVRELGEKVGIVLWSEKTESFVVNALAPFGPSAFRTPKVTLDIGTRVACVEVSPETLAHFSEQGGSRVQLASRLVGWDIRIVPQDHG